MSCILYIHSKELLHIQKNLSTYLAAYLTKEPLFQNVKSKERVGSMHLSLCPHRCFKCTEQSPGDLANAVLLWCPHQGKIDGYMLCFNSTVSKIFHFVISSTCPFIVTPDDIFWAHERRAASCTNTDGKADDY